MYFKVTAGYLYWMPGCYKNVVEYGKGIMWKVAHEFFLGAATAAHQVEGGNNNSDFWAQEQMEHTTFVELSLETCDHYHRYEEGIRFLVAAGLNAYRFLAEWEKIEPQEGHFEECKITHYRNGIACYKANGIKPIVTLTIFSVPNSLFQKEAEKPKPRRKISPAMCDM